MAQDFPTIVYIDGGNYSRDGGTYGFKGCHCQDDLDACLEEGYSLTLPEAIGEKSAPAKEIVEKEVPTSIPEREEAKAMADELGIKYSDNIKTKKLTALITAWLGESKK